MKSWYFLIIVILGQGEMLTPSPLKFKVYKPVVGNKTGVEITWNATKNWDEQHPIIGYKLVVWVKKMEKSSLWIINDGDFKGVEDSYYDPKLESLPDIANPTIITTSADERKVIYNDFEDHTIYEFSVFAFTKNGEGPISNPYRLVT